METINTKTLKIGDILTPASEHEAGFKPGQTWTLEEVERTKPNGVAVSGYKLKNATGAIQKVRFGSLVDKWLLTSHSELQALAQLESIREMVAALKAEDDDEAEKAREAIQSDALSVEVRSGWEALDEFMMEGSCRLIRPEEFKILLCTGGPAVQIIGELNEHGEPEKPRLQHQDWGTPWTDVRLSAEDEETLLAYCREFYFGES